MNHADFTIRCLSRTNKTYKRVRKSRFFLPFTTPGFQKQSVKTVRCVTSQAGLPCYDWVHSKNLKLIIPYHDVKQVNMFSGKVLYIDNLYSVVKRILELTFRTVVLRQLARWQ